VKHTWKKLCFSKDRKRVKEFCWDKCFLKGPNRRVTGPPYFISCDCSLARILELLTFLFSKEGTFPVIRGQRKSFICRPFLSCNRQCIYVIRHLSYLTLQSHVAFIEVMLRKKSLRKKPLSDSSTWNKCISNTRSTVRFAFWEKTRFKNYFEHGMSKNMHDLSLPEANEPSDVTQLLSV